MTTRPADSQWSGEMATAYERWLAPAVFAPFAVDLAARAAWLSPRTVLEIAAGTGVLTRELTTALPAASVVATDLNPAMVELGLRTARGATWRRADALGLPFGAAEFDLVICQFGVMFLPDKAAGFAELRRVLAPGGRVLVSTWGPASQHGFAAALLAALARVFPQDPPAFIAAVPHGYHDLDQISADLAAGGLSCVSAEPVTVTGRSPSAADVAAGFCLGTPLRAAIAERGDLAAATAVISEEMTAALGRGPVEAAMTAWVIEAAPLP